MKVIPTLGHPVHKEHAVSSLPLSELNLQAQCV